MKVYAVQKVHMNPHGEEMGVGDLYGLFQSRKGANGLIRDLKAEHKANYTCKDGSLRVRMPEYVVSWIQVGE